MRRFIHLSQEPESDPSYTVRIYHFAAWNIYMQELPLWDLANKRSNQGHEEKRLRNGSHSIHTSKATEWRKRHTDRAQIGDCIHSNTRSSFELLLMVPINTCMWPESFKGDIYTYSDNELIYILSGEICFAHKRVALERQTSEIIRRVSCFMMSM